MRNVLAVLALFVAVSLSAQTPYLVKDINPGPGAALAVQGQPMALTASGNLLFFIAHDGTGLALWRSDGTAAGTFKLRNASQPLPSLLGAGGYVLYADETKAFIRSDGTVDGTGPAPDFAARFGGVPQLGFHGIGDTIFAWSIFPPYVLWKTTAAPGAPAVRLVSAAADHVTASAGRYVFQSGAVIWSTDGTAEGTYTLFDLTKSAYLHELLDADGALFLHADEPGQPFRVLKSDGSVEGTTPVAGLPGQPQFWQFATAGRKFFALWDSVLWVVDAAGSTPLKLTTFDSNNHFFYLTGTGSHAFFYQAVPLDGLGIKYRYTLWASDGTPAGTKGLLTLPENYGPGVLTGIDGSVYFAGVDSNHGTEPWVSDGTSAGTKMLADLYPGQTDSRPTNFVKAGNVVMFEAVTPTYGTELWAVPLAPTLSIGDAHAAEGDAAGGVLHFPVTLSPAAAQSVSVDYATGDGTAHAGEDYDAASGTLVFAPGETSKTIDVQVRPDPNGESNQMLFVTLGNARGARLGKSDGGGLIEDDDRAADVAPRFDPATSSAAVSNAGPNAATNVAVRFTATPAFSSSNDVISSCNPCFLSQLAAGETRTALPPGTPYQQQVFISAAAAARERDPNSANNVTTWTASGDRLLIMDAPFLTPGAAATVTSRSTAVPTSSDPNVISVGAPSTVGSVVTVPVTGVHVGTATLTTTGGSTLKVDVVAPGTTPRWPGAVSMSTDNATPVTGGSKTFVLTADGTAPVSGTKATGTVTLAVDGQEVARRTINGDRVALSFVPQHGGDNTSYSIAYSGDANFLPQTWSGTLFVDRIIPSFIGTAQPVPGSPGTFTVTVEVTGRPAAPPTGTIILSSAGKEIAEAAVVPATTYSVARMTVANLPAAPVLGVRFVTSHPWYYTVDSFVAVKVGPPPRRRAAGH